MNLFAGFNLVILLTIAYVIGILLFKLPVFIAFIIILSLLFFLIATKNKNYLLLFIFLVIGFLNVYLRALPYQNSNIANPSGVYIGQVIDEPRFIDDKVFFTLKLSKGLISVIAKKARLEYGDKVELQGKLVKITDLSNPGLLSYGDFLEKQGITHKLIANRAPPKVLARGGNLFKKLSIKIKNHLMLIPQKTLPEPYNGLLSSIVFGSKAAKTPKEIKETYKKAGVAHLLVASGMHLGILVGVCLFVVRLTKLPLWLGILVVSIINFLYAVMTGFGPSILRAAIMAEIMLIGLLFEKEKEIYTSLALSALIILLFNPIYLFGVGFQLSFAATWSLVYVAPAIHDKLKNFIPIKVATLVSAAIAPVSATIPITLFHFNQFSAIGILTNILLLPWVGIIVILGFVSTVLGAIFLPLAEIINGFNLILLWIMHQVVAFLSAIPFAQVFLSSPKLPLIIFYYISIVLMVELIRRGRFPKINRSRIVIAFLIIFSFFVWNSAFSDTFNGLTVTVLDVGQGDSILIETPSQKRMLIDAGEAKAGERVVVPFLRKKGIRKLDMVVLTHPHEDHVGGLPYVLEKIKVDRVLDAGVAYNSLAYKRSLNLINKNKIKYHVARAGERINMGKETIINILHPNDDFLLENENINNASIVVKLMYKNFSMLFTGDNEEEGEEEILNLFPQAALRSQILKAGHHGSRTSTSNDFLAAVDPPVTIISCGNLNKFRHPNKSTLDKLNEKNIKVYRTDINGAVVIKSDGNTYSIELQK